ncbi:hypothetical protein [Kitasatospora sp. NPDC050543]|uniref:hypothetical protein n=1 Tax=Kitasatospora sp. NPDC050543 TaxID=3364054 RepID=UPI0037873731
MNTETDALIAELERLDPRQLAAGQPAALGADAVPQLRVLRREAGTARLRRRALEALLAAGGLDALEARDRAAVQRLVRIRSAQEVPDLGDHWWLAVPGETYEKAFDVLGLHDRVPVTVALGDECQRDDEKFVPGPGDRSVRVHRVFVTPEYAGWRLIYADTPLRETLWDLHGTIERLSAACGQAQVFYQDPHADAMMWAVAEQGAVRRGYWRYSEPPWTGEPLPWEVELMDDEDEDHDDEDYDDEDGGSGARGVQSVNQAAASLSIDPSGIDAATPVRGHGWLALTAPGAGHGGFGTLPGL